MVSDVNIGTALNQQSQTSNASVQLAEDFTQFLLLLTTQIQNQDPLSPMDSTEFTNQLVAFSGVEQQINTNQKLDSLVAMQIGNAMGSALNYVGLDASYLSSEFHYDGTNPAKIKYALQGEAVSVKLRVLDEAGEIVYEEDGSTAAGSQDFTWDGTLRDGTKAEAGTYEIRVDALDINDEGVKATTVVSGRVRGVETQGGLIYVLVGERAISLGNVLNVSQPDPIADVTPDPEPDPDAGDDDDDGSNTG